MQKKFVITIARQFGCGGRIIGARLAKRLGIQFIDKEIVSLAAKELDHDPNYLTNYDEKAPSTWERFVSSNYVYPSQTSLSTYFMQPTGDVLFSAIANVIRELSEEEPFVVVGRCADYILRDAECDLLRVFLYGDQEHRLDRIVNVYHYDVASAEKEIKKIDRQRSSYYETYTGLKWGDYRNYDVLINTSSMDVDAVVDMLYDFCVRKFELVK